MSQLREHLDPLRRFSSCYGSTDRSNNTDIVPTIDSVFNFRDNWKSPQQTTQKLKRASAKRNEWMEVTSPRWIKDDGSSLYVIVHTSTNCAIGSPLCVETGLYDGYEHLRNVSFNSTSMDVMNGNVRGKSEGPLSFASQLMFGDLIAVLKTGFVELLDWKTKQPTGQRVHVVLEYYVVQREIEYGVALAVRTSQGFDLYKSFGDQSLPPCSIPENIFLSKLNTPSHLPEEFGAMLKTTQSKQVSNLPDVFLVYAELFMPHRKCHRLANSFKAASSTSSQLLTDIAKLTSEDVANYLPYSPTPHVVTAKLLDPLHVCLQSPTRSIAMHALKALRSAKRQSGSSNFQDCRLIDTSVSGWQLAENGSLYLEVSVTAAISPAVFGVGTIVKLLAILNEPVIGKIVKLFVTNDVKTLTILINKTCGMNEEVSDEFEDNMEEKMSIEWKALVRIVTETGKCIPMLKLDFKNTFDTLMSGEKRLVRTELGDYLMKGLVDTSHSMYYGFPSPNLKPRVPSERLYGSDTSTSETLSTYQIVPFTRCLNRNPSHEELVFYQAILDPNIMVHLHESPVGSGKTTVLAAAVKARLMVQKSCRVALTAMTNSAVVALLTVFEFPTLFTSKDVSKEDVRPLVVQAKNWKTANGIPTHPFDWKEIIKKCFSHQLQNFDMTTVSDEAYSTNIKSMFVYLRNNTIIALAALLGKEKYDYLSKLKCRELNKKELVKYFFDSYKPNLLFSTMDSLVNFTTYLPADCMPSLIAIDESTMIQPSDLTLFASKMQSMSFESIEFVLVGDHKQLNPYNSVASLSPLTVSPNVMLMNYDAMVTRFTVVHRCHPDATELISKVFYGGFLVSGKDIQQTYIQHNLTGITFRKPKVKAYSYVPNATSSAAVAQSRCNSSEAHFVVEYAKKLIYLNGIKPSQISVITPYTAQAELLEKLLPQGIICSTCRRYQGLENDIVLLSCCHTGGKLETHHNVGMEGDLFLEGFQVQASENGKSNFKLIDDDSLILVSLTRSKHFTIIFGNDQFLRSIPRWKSILELILA